jgi:uncharacterized NAD(P)/FAD-binding protein YdhS
MNTAVSSLSLQSATPGLRPWLARTGAAIWRALEETGRARASRHLLDFADQCQALQPELAKELRMAASHGPLS